MHMDTNEIYFQLLLNDNQVWLQRSVINNVIIFLYRQRVNNLTFLSVV